MPDCIRLGSFFAFATVNGYSIFPSAHPLILTVGNTDTYKSSIEFSKHDKNIRFLHAWTDTIFNISKKGIIPEFILDFEKDQLTKSTKEMSLN